MGGPGSGRRRRSSPKAEPRGSRWLSTRRKVFAAHGDVCHICLHSGAGDVDHVIPVAEGDVAGYYALDNLRPAHGTHSPCPACGMVACNQIKNRSTRPTSAAQRLLAAMQRASPNGNGAKGPPERAPQSRAW